MLAAEMLHKMLPSQWRMKEDSSNGCPSTGCDWLSPVATHILIDAYWNTHLQNHNFNQNSIVDIVQIIALNPSRIKRCTIAKKSREWIQIAPLSLCVSCKRQLKHYIICSIIVGQLCMFKCLTCRRPNFILLWWFFFWFFDFYFFLKSIGCREGITQEAYDWLLR